ncbi:MAG TPA: o-succinylbenzoate synthase, partial [Opitutales bacterium]|nr:o-succinylbenzoate synthase [Opitutales bacterium]
MPTAHADYLRLEYRAYRRKFAQPFTTGGGIWTAREGVIIRLTNADGKVGFGEAAPIPTFTGETAARDLTWLRRAPDEVTAAEIHRIPARLSCLCWAFATARAMLEGRLLPPANIKKLSVAALLPAGRAAIPILDLRVEQGYRVFKWKIGVATPPEEFSLLEKLLSALPTDGKLRLDANGALARREWAAWCDGLNTLGPAASKVEFFEQPLPPATGPQCWREQTRLAKVAPVPVALDESVAGWLALKRASVAKWPGPLVVKPALLGNPEDFKRWREQTQPDLVYSSAFETSIGVQAALCLAAGDPL